jgi:hypothetical protein
MAAHFAWLANELQALPGFRGEIAVGAWANEHGLAVGYLSWNLALDPAAETVDLLLAISAPSPAATSASVTLDLAWSDGWLIAQFVDQSLSFGSADVLIEQIDALVTARRRAVINLMGRALDGEL